MTKLKYLIYVLVLILLALNVFSLGISPGIKDVNLIDGKASYQLRIYNNENKEMSVSLGADGFLKDYVKIEPTTLDFKANEDVKSITVFVNVPGGVKLAENKGSIKAREVLKGSGNVLTTIEVVSLLNLNLPAERADVKDLKVDAVIVNEGGKTRFNVNVANNGTLGIKKARVVVETVDFYEKTIDSVPSQYFSLGVSEQKLLMLNSRINPGVYKAVIYTSFEDGTRKLEKEFVVNVVDWNKSGFVAEKKEITGPNLALVIVLWLFLIIMVVINLIRYKNYILNQ